MQQFTNKHIFILPHAEEYRKLYDISYEQVLACLNEPETHLGLAAEHYTVEKSFGTYRVYLYYYLTLPLQGRMDEAYAIIDFIGYTANEDLAEPTLRP